MDNNEKSIKKITKYITRLNKYGNDANKSFIYTQHIKYHIQKGGISIEQIEKQIKYLEDITSVIRTKGLTFEQIKERINSEADFKINRITAETDKKIKDLQERNQELSKENSELRNDLNDLQL
jgi:predicted RNase H-like nuclease (RuvC/YqgF family)